jgi:hypothetical protein
MVEEDVTPGHIIQTYLDAAMMPLEELARRTGLRLDRVAGLVSDRERDRTGDHSSGRGAGRLRS